ncbi:MAG TPA: VOC family protein [Sphingomicrobium sp.]|jgi:PhnB protein|nr:VOC family protein [Sphingomicrobium sp.]
MTKPIPDGYRSVNLILTVDDGARAIDFYKKAFGAKEISRLPMGDKIGHAELQIGDTRFMLNDEFPEHGNLGPNSRGGPTVGLVVYTEDADSAFKTALDAGGTETMPVADQFWGDRMGTLRDPFGYKWSIATHVEDVPPEEFADRMAASQNQPQTETV